MTASELLATYGITMAQAHVYLDQHLDDPSGVYAVAMRYGVTNAMLGEVAGYSAADVEAWFSYHGINSSGLDVTLTDSGGTATQLASFGATMAGAHQYLMAHLDDPAYIFQAAETYCLTNQMLGDIAGGYSADEVKAFFLAKGIDSSVLDGSGDTDSSSGATPSDTIDLTAYSSLYPQSQKIDVSDGAYVLEADMSNLGSFHASKVTVYGFGADDSIVATNVESSVIVSGASAPTSNASAIFSGYDGQDVFLTLVGVNPAGVFVASIDQFNALAVGDMSITG